MTTIATNIELKKALCDALGIDSQLVSAIRIVADAEPGPVRVEVHLYPSREKAVAVVEALRAHTAGLYVEVR